MAVGNRNIALHNIRTTRDGDRIVCSHTRTIEICYIVITIITQVYLALVWHFLCLTSQSRGWRFSDFGSPTVGFTEITLRVNGSSITILYLGSGQWDIKSNIARIGYRDFPASPFLRCNHEHTVCCTRTIQGSSIGTLQHVDALYVIGVYHGESIATFCRDIFSHVLRIIGLVTDFIGHGYTIDNNQGRRIAQNGLVTTKHDLRSTACTTSTWGNDNACDLAFQRVGNIGVLHLHKVVGRHLLGRISQ